MAEIKRVKTPSYILELGLLPSSSHVRILKHLLHINAQIYNVCLGSLLKRYKQMIRTKKYREYAKNKNFEKLNELLKEYRLSKPDSEKDMLAAKEHFGNAVDSNTAQKTAERAFKAFEKLLKGKAKQVHFKRANEMDSFEGKSNKQGIRFSENHLMITGLKPIKTIIPKNDAYAVAALRDRVKYCRIVMRVIRGNERFYAQLVLEGIPPQKIDPETGKFKRQLGTGDVGVDIGTSTVAVASQTKVFLEELSPETKSLEGGIKLLQRKMDRSKRATNPNKYNADGTNKRGDRTKWNFSKRYAKLRNAYQEHYRKLGAKRKASHNKKTNATVHLGDKFYVEKMSFAGLQKRSKKTKISPETGKIQKKKRFGKSIGNKAPSMFISLLQKKVEQLGGTFVKVDTASFKASQYDHMANVYRKKKLSERKHVFENGIAVQRDKYSAFLLQNSKKNGKAANRKKCLAYFDDFLKLHSV